MTRNFGMGDGRPTVGAFRQPSVSIGQYTPSNLNSFAGRADSLRGDWPDSGGFGRPPFIQMMIDLAAVVSIVVLSCVAGVSIAAAGFILLFVGAN